MSIFQRIFESAPDAIVVSDRDGRMVRVNAEAEKLFRYSQEELLGQPVELLVPERLRIVHLAKRESEPARHHEARI